MALTELLQTLRAANGQWARLIGKLCVSYDINASERYLLQHLFQTEAQTISQIAQHRQVSRQHVQGLVHPLVKKSLLALHEKPSDKRSVLVTLTSAGEQLIQSLIHQEQQYIEQLAERFLEEDLELTNKTLYALTLVINALPIKSGDIITNPDTNE